MVIDAPDSSRSWENVNSARWILHGAEAPFIPVRCAEGGGGGGGACHTQYRYLVANAAPAAE